MKLLKIYINSYKGLSQESWMLALVMLINRSGSMVLPFLGVYMTDHLDFSIKNAGFVLSFFGIGSVIGSWFGGLITDKIGEYKVQSLSLLLSVPMFCLIPIFKTEAGLATIIFLQSCISEAFRPANSVAITKYAQNTSITRAFSLNRMAINLGFSIGPALGGILSAISYDFLFYSNAFGALVAGLVYVIYFRKRNISKQKHDVMQTQEKTNTSPYTDFKFLVFVFICFLFSVCFFQFLNTMTIFYKEGARLSQQNIGYILGYSGFIIVVLEMLLVQISEKYFSLKFTVFLGSILCAIGFGMMGFGVHWLYLLISISIISIGEIWTLPFMSTITALRSGVHNKGAYMGLNGMAFSVSFIVTPFLGTWIAEHFGFQKLWISTGVLLVICAIAFYIIIPWLLENTSISQKSSDEKEIESKQT